MKNFTLTITLLNIFIHVQAQQVQYANCNPATAQTELDIANVRATIMTGGDMWWDLVGSARYEVPKGSGKHSLYTGGLWFGGYDNNGNLRVAAQTDRQAGNDFWPGPVSLLTTDVTPAVCSQFDRHWRLTRSEVEDFISVGIASQTIIDYPGNGDINNSAHFLAPYYDMNSDGSYNYLDGDYPMFNFSSNQSGCNCTELHGDQVLWWVINDVGNVHTNSSSTTALGLEIQCQAFAFATADDDIRNATFYEYKIICRNTTTDLNNMWLGFFVDVDLGNYLDDYVGCDVGRGLGYGYNGDWTDEGISGYGVNPPAVGLDIIHGPTADTSDGIDNDMDSCIDCTFLKDTNGVITDTIPDSVSPEKIKMSRFICYNNSFDPVNGNPNSAEDFYDYMRGAWRNGNIMTYGGNGHGGGTGATNDISYYMYPGNSDPYHWGTNGVPENDWDEISAGNMPDDRRFLTSVGPFTMLPGQVQCVQTAVLWARDTAGPLSSVEKLKLIDDKIGGGSLECPSFPDGINNPEEIIQATAFPVPATDHLSFSFNKYISAGTVSIYDMHGKIMTTKKFTGDRTSISCRDFSTGVYFYQVKSATSNITSGRFVKN